MRRSVLGFCCVIALFVACFWPVLSRGEQFGYRDAGHYYYPLYQRVQQEWAKLRLPLWDARENGGVPLLGNPTAAVLYPGKLIYAVLPYPWAARTYVIAHVLLAFGGMYRLMRGWGTTAIGSLLSAMAYSFGAPILFQYCNVIFLVGAAWAPFGFAAMDRWLRTGHRASLGVLGLVLAMQTLGGDPEAAYLTGLCGGGYALGLGIARARESRARRPLSLWFIALTAIGILAIWTAGVLAFAIYSPGWRPKGPPVGPLPVFRWWPRILAGVWVAVFLGWQLSVRARRGSLIVRLVGLGFAGLLGGLICAGQLLPVMEFTNRTMRATPDGPHDIYPFSVEPYRMAEWIWPQVFGSSLAGNNTWGIFIPPRHQTFIWVPSLYMGVLPLILAVSAMGLRGQGARRIWLSWVAVISMAAVMGEYAGPLWVARCLPPVAKIVGPHDPSETSAIRTDAKMRDGDGSIYGLMAITLPGFSGFRYPAKLLTFTCLSMAGLAGIGFDRLLAGRSRRALKVVGILAITSVALLVFVQSEQTEILAWFASKSSLKGLSAFGPFDPLGTWKELRFSLSHGTSFLCLGVVVLASLKRFPQLASSLLLVLVAADLGLANSPLILTVPQRVFEDRPEVLTRIAEAEAADPSPGPFRVHRMPYWDPSGFHSVSSPNRFREMVEWERKTLQPKYGIPLGISYTFTEGVAELYDLSWFFAPFPVDLNLEGGPRGKEKSPKLLYFPRKGFDLWATRYFVVPAIRGNDERRGSAAFSFDIELVWPKEDSRSQFQDEWEKTEDWRIYKNKRAFPRAWIVHQADFGHPIEGDSRESRQDRHLLMQRLVYAADPLWRSANQQVHDLRRKAFIEIEDQSKLVSAFSNHDLDPAESVEFVLDDSVKVVLQAHLTSPGMIVLSDVYYPGWDLYVDGKPTPILRVNRMMRGALVTAGDHRIVYVYNPRSVRLGMAISVSGAFLTIWFLLWCRTRPSSPALSEAFA